jgi:acyl-[acyl-carrier-protein]-phospholipid O-acyltransferase/long-chain-fatty-acid--[acyl-carrier-protein] ligase
MSLNDKGNGDRLFMGLTLPFHALNLCQFLITLNDATARMLVIFFLNDLLGIEEVNRTLFLTSLAIVVPFLVFSMLGGQLADRYPKGIMIRWLQLVSILGAFLILGSMHYNNGVIVYLGLFLMALQASLFSPARLAIIPEIVETNKIPFANSILTGSNYIALLIGAFVASFLTILSDRNFNFLGSVLVFLGLLAGLASLFVRSTHSFPGKPVEWNFVKETYKYLKLSCPIPHLFHVIVYGSYFLLACLFTQLNLIPLGYQELNITDAETGYILLYTSLGLGIGSVLYGLVSKKNIEVSYALIGGLGTALSYFGIVFCPHNFIAVSIMGFLIGLSGGFFIVPLNGFTQTKSPEPIRASVLAASNTLGFVFLLIGAAFLELTGGILNWTAHQNFIFLALFTLFMWFLFAYEFRYALFRPIFVLYMNLFYKVEGELAAQKIYSVSAYTPLSLMGLMILFEPMRILKDTANPSRGVMRWLWMFCSVIEIDLKKDKDRFIAVTKQMEQEGGVVILSSGPLMDVEEIVCEKKGNTLTFSTVKR